MKKTKISTRLSARQKQKLQGTVFLLPAVIGLAVVFIPAMILSFRMSMSSISIFMGKGYELTLNNLENYKFALTKDPTFTSLLVDSFANYNAIWVRILACIILSLFLAVVLNQNFKGRVVARVILFLPVILCTGLVNNVDAAVNQGFAVVNIGELDVGSVGGFNFAGMQEILYSTGLMPELVDTLVILVNSLYNIVINSGVQILIFLAGLQSVPKSLFEAGRVDGMTGWQSFWKITVPLISPLILVNIIYSIVSYMTDGSNPVMRYIVEITSQIKSFPLASAYAWIYFSVMGFFVAAVMLISRKLVFYNS